MSFTSRPQKPVNASQQEELLAEAAAPHAKLGVGKTQRKGRRRGAPVLTARQVTVLVLKKTGVTCEEAAQSLGIATTTVERHLANIYQRLGVSGFQEAWKAAVRRRVVTAAGVAITRPASAEEASQGGPGEDGAERAIR